MSTATQVLLAGLLKPAEVGVSCGRDCTLARSRYQRVLGLARRSRQGYRADR